MDRIIIVISILIALISMGIYIGFSQEEGKDERGNLILSKASHITIGFLFLTYSAFVFIVEFLNISTVILKVVIVIALSLLILINAISIMYFRKKL